MDWAGKDNPAEWAVDVAAALMFAFAAGFAGWSLALDARPIHAALAGPAFLLAYNVLRHWPRDERTYALPVFELAPVVAQAAPAAACDELLLESGQALAPCSSEAELLLDDPLVRIGPGSRVVRLFDPERAPRGGDRSQSRCPDASHALSQALAQLRHSLR